MKKIMTIIAMFLCFALGACAVSTVSAEQPHPLKIWKQNSNGHYDTLVVVDEDTGVNYVVVSMEDVVYGRPCGSISVTPRLNADGTPYISE